VTGRNDLSEERDEVLVRHLAVAARSLRGEFREWIQAELKDLLVKAQAVESVAEGPLKGALHEAAERVRDIDEHELPEAIRTLDEEIERIAGGAYSDVLDAHRYLQDVLCRLERLVREVLAMRAKVGGLWSSGREGEE
jgi:hypothetical protein